MAERLMGQETEYAVTATRPDGSPVTHDEAASLIYAAARTGLNHLPCGDGSGMFIASGGRFYVDSGSHPELTTPECPNPWDVARYIKAGERILTELVDKTVADNAVIGRAALYRGNVDYSGAGKTWGCHESYLHRCADLDLMRRQLVPHLVSRVIYTGAGGFHPLCVGTAFLLSPRAVHLRREVSEHTTDGRAIFNTRQEHLATNGNRRLHLICGESLFSETAMFLKAGATALVISMIENSAQPGDPVRLRSPLNALRRFVRDPLCRATAPTTDGGALSACQIQWHYLQCAEEHLGSSWMPPWAEAVCREWRRTLDLLETGAPASVATTLDWAIKYSLFSARLARRGLTLERAARWTPLLLRLQEAMGLANGQRNLLIPEEFYRLAPLAGRRIQRLDSAVRRRGLDWDELPAVLQSRQELFEIDWRCGQLGANGILTALDRAGVLTHHFPGVDNIEHAMTNPPASGRARLRGQTVQQLFPQVERYRCGWTGVWDLEQSQVMDLGDPFAAEAAWKPTPKPADVDPMWREVNRMLGRALACYDKGAYEEGFLILRPLTGMWRELPPTQARECLRYAAWSRSRSGFVDGTQYLDLIPRPRELSLDLINDYVCVLRYQGFVPPPAMWDWIRLALSVIQNPDRSRTGTRAPFLGHYAFALRCTGRLNEALATLDRALSPEIYNTAHPHAQCRLLAEMGEVQRRLGNREAAIEFLDRAEIIQTANGFLGDQADFTFLGRAKLSQSVEEAMNWLKQAEGVQVRLRNRMGEARAQALIAGISEDANAIEQCRHRLDQHHSEVPALQHCPALQRILDRWSEWISPDRQPDEHNDYYWGV